MRPDAGFRSRFHGRLVFVTFKVTFDGGDPIAFGDQSTYQFLEGGVLAMNPPDGDKAWPTYFSPDRWTQLSAAPNHPPGRAAGTRDRVRTSGDSSADVIRKLTHTSAGVVAASLCGS